MSAAMTRAGETSGKRGQVLDAAQACFVRHGFHRASMNDIAREATMSTANLYRYFDSKEALIVGLVERETQRGAALAATLQNNGDARAQLLGIMHRYFLSIDHDEAVMRVEIWAEACHNPEIGTVVKNSQASAHAWLLDMFSKLATSSDCNPEDILSIVAPLLDGVVVAIATVPNYDAAPTIAHLHALLDAGLAGRLPVALVKAGR